MLVYSYFVLYMFLFLRYFLLEPLSQVNFRFVLIAAEPVDDGVLGDIPAE